MTESKILQNFVLVRVSETYAESKLVNKPAARIVTAIHDCAEENKLAVATAVQRQGRGASFWATNGSRHTTIRELFDTMTYVAPETLALLTAERAERDADRFAQDPYWKEAQERRHRKSRAMRAKAIVENYVEEFGDDL